MMKHKLLLLIALSAICFCTKCSDGSTCLDTQTCCELESGYGCCAYEKGVCCTDKKHCCPYQYSCDLEKLLCKKELNILYMPAKNYIPLAVIKANQLSYDWNSLLKCILATQPVVKEVIDLIEAIISKDYSKAIELMSKIIQDGSSVVSECFKVMRQNKHNIDWDSILKCLKKFPPLVPEVMELIKRIEKGDYIKAMTLIYELIEKGITIVQECFGQELNWDWDALLQCILKAEPLAKDILELIAAIQNGDYAKATEIVFQVIKDGSEIIIQCLKV